MSGLLEFLFRVFFLVMELLVGGVMGVFVGVMVLTRSHRPSARSGLAVRVVRWTSVLCFGMAPLYFMIVRNLGKLVGSTTRSGNPGLAADGRYYLYVWWRPDHSLPVSPEKYWTLYWCEHLIWAPFVVAVLLLGLAVWLEQLRSSEGG